MTDPAAPPTAGTVVFRTPYGTPQVRVYYGYQRPCGRHMVAVDLPPSCHTDVQTDPAWRGAVWLWELPAPGAGIGEGLAQDEVDGLLRAAAPGETLTYRDRVLRRWTNAELDAFLSATIDVLVGPPPRVRREFGMPVTDTPHECPDCYWT